MFNVGESDKVSLGGHLLKAHSGGLFGRVIGMTRTVMTRTVMTDQRTLAFTQNMMKYGALQANS